MYEIETTVAARKRMPVELVVETMFRLKTAELTGGDGLEIHAANVNGKSLLDGRRVLTSVVTLLNLIRPTVEKGVLSFTVCNPTNEAVSFKLTIK